MEAEGAGGKSLRHRILEEAAEAAEAEVVVAVEEEVEELRRMTYPPAREAKFHHCYRSG